MYWLLVLCFVFVRSYDGSTAPCVCLQSTLTMAQFTGDQAKQLADTLGAAGLTPEMATPEGIEAWMLTYLESQGKLGVKQVKEEPKVNVTKGQPGAKDDKEGSTVKAVYQPPPRLSTFSGDPTAKGDAQFDLWMYEVECLLREGVHSQETVKQAMRKALKGNAARIVMRKGTDATCQEILSCLETVYGLVETGENLLAEFYAARQTKDEDAASWSCRLEDLLERATEKGHIPEKDKAGMLKTKFWTGLQQNLKDGSRHKYDTDISFDELRVVVRRLEREYDIRGTQDRDGKTSGKAQAKMAVSGNVDPHSQEGDGLGELKAMVNKLSNQMAAMQKQLNATKPSSGKSNLDKSGFQKGGNNASAGSQKKGQTASGQEATGTSTKRSQDWKCYRCEGRGHIARDCPSKRVPVCWDCGVEGHTKWNCPQSLNADKPLSKGGQQV